MAVRFTPAPPPQIENNNPLRVYLDQQFRNVANSQPEELLEGLAVLSGSADNVIANNVTETAIVNYARSFSTAIIEADPVLGTMTLPNQPGIVSLTVWTSLNQVTASRDFTVQLKLEINGSWADPILASGYLPQQGSDAHLGLSMSGAIDIAGGEVLRMGLLLDNQASAEFAISDGTFELQYLSLRG